MFFAWAIAGADNVIREYHAITGVLMHESPPGRLNAATDLIIMADRRILVASSGDNRIVEFDRTGAYVALAKAMHKLTEDASLPAFPLRCAVAATSAGVIEEIPLLDLNYEEDAGAEVDFNVVMTEEGELVEVQGTGESHPFTRQAMDELLSLAEGGIRSLFEVQKAALAQAGIVLPATAERSP